MDGWEKTKVGAGIALACAVLAGGFWFGGQVVAPVYPERRAYVVEGVAPVDLAAVQRGWPGVSGGNAERAELLGYIGHIDKAVVPVAADAAAPAEPVADLGTLLAAADAERGKRTAQPCMACHDFNPGGPNGIGPNLWGVVGRQIASHAGFAYSPALRAYAGQWTYAELDRFLASPARAAPGTKMAYAGLRNPRDRANLLAFLATAGAARPPYPEPGPAAAPSGTGSAALQP